MDEDKLAEKIKADNKTQQELREKLQAEMRQRIAENAAFHRRIQDILKPLKKPTQEIINQVKKMEPAFRKEWNEMRETYTLDGKRLVQ